MLFIWPGTFPSVCVSIETGLSGSNAMSLRQASVRAIKQRQRNPVLSRWEVGDKSRRRDTAQSCWPRFQQTADISPWPLKGNLKNIVKEYRSQTLPSWPAPQHQTLHLFCFALLFPLSPCLSLSLFFLDFIF